ncbi:MAG: bifunctional [glutamate--ammonia ligase]-adenylyl-L-tyrosine phosphorylase/[glutamate--ammonia-ligase] adenylyltransferase, partial [Gammaproteobacteria bacterium]|nr:bifunctional [glutamate--ammonia ligase]-adenylyl-L-tyrosine phosphorylase/[glutamate--ammonia-ligase] adenylyltransferase [Gammaproteobacteria bacterium]
MTFRKPDNSAETFIRTLPAALIEPASRWQERLNEQFPGEPARSVGAGQLPSLFRLVASSEFAARVLLREWSWFSEELATSRLSEVPTQDALTRRLHSVLLPMPDLAGLKRDLRVFRNRQLIGILWRDLDGTADVPVTLATLSALADAMIVVASNYVRDSLAERYGEILAADGGVMSLIVLAMGKLGGHELNFSSDVDLVFLYPADGESNGERPLSANEYFTRWARQLVQILDETTEDGFVYRVDTRLRPFGDSGPLVVSLAALEAYLLQHGRSWERYAYVKARVIDSPADGQQQEPEFLDELIRPFVYRRYLDYGVFESLREMKSLISAEVRKRELESNIKLGPGGIREIEFIVQSLQLVRGGADRTFRGQSLLRVLPRLVHGSGLTIESAQDLTDAYLFLRRLENIIQAARDLQTHDLPRTDVDQQRAALAMGYADWKALQDDLQRHRAVVSRHFADVAFRTDAGQERPEQSRRVLSLWDSAGTVQEWRPAFTELGIRDADALAELMAGFAQIPAIQQLDSDSRRRVNELVPALLPMLKHRNRPAIALERILRIVEQVLRRSAYIALLNENPAVLGRLVGLCEGSDYLAKEIARFPVLLDEMLDPRRYSADLTPAEMQADLGRRLAAVDWQDSEQRVETLAQFQRATLFRIAVADFSGTLPIMKVSDRLTELAELVLKNALEIAWSDVVSRHGEPWYDAGDGPRKAGFGVIAYGKLGGMELSYGSDLDLVFLHDSHGREQQTDGQRALDNSMFFGRLVRRLVHFLTIQTASGVLYEVDTRLRPDGRSGLLVTSVEAFERYQEENAWTWEHQALLRSRPVAGSATVARDFERVRSETLKNRIKREQLLEDVLNMRDKMRKQLDKSSEESFDLKQGKGGIGDIEFLVQYLVLKNAAAHPAVIHYSDNIRQLGTLSAAKCLDEVDASRMQQIYRDYRLRLHRLALDGRPPIVDSSEFATERGQVLD